MTGPLLAAAAERLAAAGVPTPQVDAELLLAHVLGVPRGRLVTAVATPAQEQRFDAAVARRTAREPLQHIVGTAPFRHVEVAVGSGVFVPRPETELLVDAVLPLLRATSRPIAADLCAGSGALALALADEVRTARVYAVERPGPAADWLARNTAGTRVTTVRADIRQADLLADLWSRVDAVVCNPPYVPAGAPVAAEVRQDPEPAVFAGPDGLALIPAVIGRAAELLRTGGLLAVEHHESHATAVPALLAADGRFTDIRDEPDLTGRARYAVATRV